MALTPQEEQELASLEAELAPKQRAPSNSGLTPEEEAELQSLESEFSQPTEPGLLSSIGDGALNALSSAGEFIDSYSGAPTRAAIGAAMTGNNPLTAFGSQFGEDPKLAPTGKEIAQVAGLSNETRTIPRNPMAVADEARAFNRPVPTMTQTYSPADVAGVGIDLVADPLNFIPVAPIASALTKGGVKATVGTAKYALKSTVAGIEALADTNKITKAAETTGKYLDEVASSLKKSINPTRADDFKKFEDIATKNGIDPSSLPETVEFGPNSSITKKSKVIAEGPAGEPVQARYMKAQADVENALENQISSMAGGAKPSHGDAGTALLDGYNKGIKSFFDQDMLTHSKVVNENPGMVLNQDALKNVTSKIKGLQNKATGRLRRGIGGQRAEAQSLLDDLDIVQRSMDKNGNLSYKRASEMLTNIGEEAFKKYPPGTKIPTDQKGLRDLYFSLRDSMYETAGHVMGPEAATEMAMNNQIISDFLKEKGRISKIFEGDIAPEKLFKRIADSGDTKQINALKEVLSPEDFQKFKGAYLDNLIVRNGEGTPLYRSTRKKLLGKADQIKSILSTDEVQNFDELLQLGDRIGSHVFNTSNTNTAARFSPTEFAKEILSGGVDELTLEKLKESARSKAKAIEVPFENVTETVTPSTARAILKKLPLLNSTTRQGIEGGRLSSIQETNKEIERRRRATAGN